MTGLGGEQGASPSPVSPACRRYALAHSRSRRLGSCSIRRSAARTEAMLAGWATR